MTWVVRGTRNSVSDEVRRAAFDRVRQIRESELGSPLQIEIAARLIGARRTATELTSEIYGPGEDLKVEYARVRREVKRLESRGLVAAVGLLGRERPYRLTQYGATKLFGLAGVEGERLVDPKDLVLHISTATLLVVLLFAPSAPGWSYLLFSFMAGASAVRIMELLGKVS